jgi:DNA polymerase I-like protein with 3'-5' exonuclease and polymerase domains
MKTILFDLETDGFLEAVTKIHCLVIKDVSTGEVKTFTKADMLAGLDALEQADQIIGHNVLKYDLPVIQKLYPGFTYDQRKVMDTLVCSRLIWPNVGEWDAKLVHNGKMPAKLWGSHSLKAWGYRLEKLKGEYGETSDWKDFTPEMLEYCIQDVEVTAALYDRIKAKEYPQKALDLEHETAYICARMERSGWPFDKDKAAELYAELAGKRQVILDKMKETFEPEVIERVSEKTGKPLKSKVIEFNPSSRQQIGDRLIRKYGWKPKEYTQGGQPKIDETILKALDYPEAQDLAEYFMLEKRIGQLAEGDNAWLKLERNGVIHGSYNTNGAVTGRATHQSPNLAQVPSVRSPYGRECRSLFTVRSGFSLVGADLSGLELRCLAHYMSKWDDGEYTEELLNGDIHTKNQKAAGLPTRDNAKTFIYSFLYGAGDEKIGAVVGAGAREGKRLKEAFLSATPALAKLRDAVTKASSRGYLIGLDGRKLHIRSEHAALNTLLQSAGALISKQWLIEIDKAIKDMGLVYDKDWSMLGWVHDEVQSQVKEGYEEQFGQKVIDAARKAGEFFEFRCPIAAEFQIGRTWYDTH